MKRLVIFLILILSSFSFADSSISEKYAKMKEEQKYRFAHEMREVRHRNKIRIVNAKADQKIHRGRCNRYYSCRSSYRSIYAMRACP